MKLKKIAGLVQREQSLYICHWNGMCKEMVGPYCALYEVDDLPGMGRDAWLAALDVPAEKRENIKDRLFVDNMPGDIELDLKTILAAPVVSKQPLLVFLHKGKTIWAMEDDDGGITFLDAALLGPIEEKQYEMHVLQAQAPAEARMLCVMVGMELRAVLVNYNMSGSDRREDFEKVTAAMVKKPKPETPAEEVEQTALPEGEAQ